jgi:hypothetical protein
MLMPRDVDVILVQVKEREQERQECHKKSYGSEDKEFLEGY